MFYFGNEFQNWKLCIQFPNDIRKQTNCKTNNSFLFLMKKY